MEALAGDAVDSAALAGRAVLGPVQESGPACLPGIPGSIPGSELSILSLLVPRTACSSRRRGPEAEPGCGRHPIWGLVVARAGAGAGALPGSPGTRIPRGLTYWLLRPLTQVLFSACLSPIQAPALLTCRASTDCYRLIPSWIKPLRLAPGLQGPSPRRPPASPWHVPPPPWNRVGDRVSFVAASRGEISRLLSLPLRPESRRVASRRSAAEAPGRARVK